MPAATTRATVAAMTESRLTAPLNTARGWSSLAVIGPAAAAALAFATGWAMQHQPHPAVAATPQPPASHRDQFTVDHQNLALTRQAMLEQERVQKLERALRRVQNNADALRKAPLPRIGSSSGLDGSAGGYTAPSRSGGGVSAPIAKVAPLPAAPAPAPAPAPKPAPVVHTKSGAS